MNPSTALPSHTAPVDQDMAEQAVSGHGIPSQDPDPAAQTLLGSGRRTHRAIPHSQLVKVSGAPHGLNVSHAQAFNDALLTFLRA